MNLILMLMRLKRQIFKLLETIRDTFKYCNGENQDLNNLIPYSISY